MWQSIPLKAVVDPNEIRYEGHTTEGRNGRSDTSISYLLFEFFK
jgi:hypothetical protein